MAKIWQKVALKFHDSPCLLWSVTSMFGSDEQGKEDGSCHASDQRPSEGYGFLYLGFNCRKALCICAEGQLKHCVLPMGSNHGM